MKAKEPSRYIRLWWEYHNQATILWLGTSSDPRTKMLGGIPAHCDTWKWVACPPRLRERIARVACAAGWEYLWNRPKIQPTRGAGNILFANCKPRVVYCNPIDSFPVGTPVTVTLDNGGKWETKTRGEPRRLKDGTWIVALDGGVGAWDLERVKPR